MTLHHERPLPHDEMIHDDAHQGPSRRHGLVFLLVFLGWCGLAVFLDFRLHGSSAGASIAFSRMGQDLAAVNLGLTRTQESELKLQYLKSDGYVPPDVGMFGNHQARHFSAASMARMPGTPSYFNFWHANLGLPELRDYLGYIESMGRLPKRMILVMITTPNNDNGKYIVDYGTELPIEVLSHAQQWGMGNIIPALRYFAQEGRLALSRVMRYSTMILGVFAGDTQIYLQDVRQCEQPMQIKDRGQGAWTTGLEKMIPGVVLAPFGGISAEVLCRDRYLDGAYRADGSVLQRSASKANLNENDLSLTNHHLNNGDEVRIARAMSEINAIGKRNGLPVVFFIPPVYETDRPSLVDQVFSAALTRVPDLKVVDHRHLRLGAEYFYHYDHPREIYFDLVAAEAARYLETSP